MSKITGKCKEFCPLFSPQSHVLKYGSNGWSLIICCLTTNEGRVTVLTNEGQIERAKQLTISDGPVCRAMANSYELAMQDRGNTKGVCGSKIILCPIVNESVHMSGSNSTE